jgi:hypothetical protein
VIQQRLREFKGVKQKAAKRKNKAIMSGQMQK